MYRSFFKPLSDRVFGIFGLVLLSPLLFIISIILMIDFKGTPFFTQNRVGKGGRVFRIYKFKTMIDPKGENDPAHKDRLTFVGKILRKTSLDELPQFLNLIIGNMSLIGPRPLLVEYLPLYSEEEAQRHLVKPGITGLAQVNGRNALTWEEKFAFDIDYARELGLTLDIKIFFKSVVKPFERDGVYSIAEEVEPFKGHGGKRSV